MKKYLLNKNGMTLLEILLYLSLASVVLLSVSVFITSIFRARIKNEAVVLVNEEAAQIISQLQIEISEADTINQPAEGAAAASIEFQVTGDPVETIDLQSQQIIYTLTGNLGIALNSTKTNVTNINFTRMNTVSDNESIKVEFSIERDNSSGLQEYEFSKTFYTTINIPRKTGETETYL
ncbi:hypothetical protein JW978_00875 [Candidatus Dojkabacteria bacterium]|nr:hypothetical protein [Candidatus Dojkabacteria bacterium]